jgi:hypothetical protein
VLHSRSLPNGGVAAQLRRKDDRHAINGRLLDSLYDILEERGFEVFLVNARDVTPVLRPNRSTI